MSTLQPRRVPNAQGNATSGQFYAAFTDASAAPAFGVGFGDAFGDNTTGGAGAAWYYARGANGSIVATMQPPTNPDSNLRVGSSSTPSASTSWSFDGDLFYVLFYRESHSLAQQAEVNAWMRGYMVTRQCDQPLQLRSETATSVNLVDRCFPTASGVAYGYGAMRCYMTCSSGFQWYMVSPPTHYFSMSTQPARPSTRSPVRPPARSPARPPPACPPARPQRPRHHDNPRAANSPPPNNIPNLPLCNAPGQLV